MRRYICAKYLFTQIVYLRYNANSGKGGVFNGSIESTAKGGQ